MNSKQAVAVPAAWLFSAYALELPAVAILFVLFVVYGVFSDEKKEAR